MSGPKLRYALVIPALNESATLREVVSRALSFVERIIVVDDGSTDGTADQLRDLSVTVIRHPTNRGKGASLLDGMQRALSEGPLAGVVTMDGDGQHDPAEIPRLIAAAADHPRWLVIGSRLWNRDIIPVARYRANRFANFWIAWASGQPVEDSQSGFRVYPAELIRQINLNYPPERGFVFESEVIIEAGWRGYPSLFVPVATVYPKNARPSHFRPVADIARITRMVAGRLLARGFFPQGLWRSLREKPARVSER